MRPDSHARKIRLLTFGILAGATLFAADLLLSTTFAIAPAYVALLLISLWMPDRRSTVGIATVATGLIVAAFFLTRADETSPVVAAAVCLYRVCQESLRNVSKHSKADEAKVLLEADEDGLTLVVSDSGVGFDPETTMGGMDLLGMRERARLAGGTFEVRSRPGAGTAVAAFVPIAWADEGLAAAAGA